MPPMVRGPGLSKARRGASLRRGALTREGEELLFALAERLSEGEMRQTRSGRAYFGSTMLTVRGEDLAPYWRGALDLDHLRQAIDGSVRVRLRAMRLACADATHRAPSEPLGTAVVETRITRVDDRLHIDVDVEVPLDLARAGGHAPEEP